MKSLLLSVFILLLGLQSRGQEIECYCFQTDAPVLLNLQSDATKLVEWIIIQDRSAAVVSYMDKTCEQPWSFFEEMFREQQEKNSVYQITEVGDSLVFTKVFNFNVRDQALSQEYVYNGKLYSDSLKVHIDYPSSDNSPMEFNDLAGSPDRTYIKVSKK